MVKNFSGISNRTILGKILRVPLHLIPKEMTVPILQGPLRGKLWIAGSSNHGCWLGSYEYEKQKVFIKRVKPGDVVFDIGAGFVMKSTVASHGSPVIPCVPCGEFHSSAQRTQEATEECAGNSLH